MWGEEVLENLESIDGFELVQGNMFGRKYSGPMMSINTGGILFSVTTHIALDNCECVQVLINPRQKKVLVRPVSSREAEAINWTSGEKKATWTSCPKLVGQMYSLWGLNPKNRYRIPGKTVVHERKAMVLFDFESNQVVEEPMLKTEQ